MPWLTLLGPLIPVLVTQVERLFGKKTGSTKLNTVLSAVTPILTNLVNAQLTGGPMPPTADVVSEIEKVVVKLFPSGTTYTSAADPLVTPPAPVVPPAPLVSAPVSAGISGLSSDQRVQLIKAVLAL